MKHAPATPLPWFSATDCKVAHLSGGFYHYPISTEKNEDAAYIAHAANAYPRLVQELRLANVGSNGEQRKGTPIGLLLWELGELGESA